MKKLVGLLVVASFFLSSAVSVQAATYNSVEKPSAAIENASIWNRDVGDGVDTFKYENGNWVPVKSTSKRRSAAKKDYIEKVVTPNKESRKIAEELKQSYLAEAKKNPEAFAALAEEKSMMVSYTDDLGTHEVKIPKVDVPAEVEEPADFFVSETVPVELEVLDSTPTVTTTDQDSNQRAFPKLEELTYKVQNDKVLTKAELLEKVTYDGDKNDITVELYSKMVYSIKGSTEYHHDLNTLLGKTSVDKIDVLSEQEALGKDLVAASDDSTQIEKINLSLPGQYTVSLKTQYAVAQTTLNVEGSNDTIVEPDPEPTPTPQPITLRVADHTFPVEVGSYLNNAALLDLANYTGNKSNLKISIATEYVYVTPNAEVYHIDLHELLSKANLSTIAVMTEQEAVNKGLRLSTENNDKGGIDTIDRSLPGKYRVTYTDGQTSATSVITIGEVKTEEQIVTPTTPVRPNQTATAKTVPTTQGKSLPQTGSTNSNLLIVIGALILAAAAFLYWKKSSKKA